MRVRGEDPTWAVTVLASKHTLEAVAREAYRQLFRPGGDDSVEDFSYDWEVAGGTGQWTAVRGDDPSGEDALLVAPLISRRLPGRVYAAVIPEHLRGSYVWENGHSLGEVARSPEMLVEELGVPFPKLGHE